MSKAEQDMAGTSVICESQRRGNTIDVRINVLVRFEGFKLMAQVNVSDWSLQIHVYSSALGAGNYLAKH